MTELGEGAVLTERRDGVLVVTINRPEAKNAVNGAVAAGIAAALDGALELAATIAANGPLAVAVTKQIATSARDWSTAEGWQRQSELMMPVFGSEDAQEGATAFAEKRPPVWKGK